MEQVVSTDKIKKAVIEAGYEEGEYKVTVTQTKELKFERVKPEYSIEQVFPHPISKVDKPCPICAKSFLNHGYVTYFVDPLHIRAVNTFYLFLLSKLDTAKVMPLKLAIEAPNTVLTSKEIFTHIYDSIKQVFDPKVTNYLIHLATYLTPSQFIRYIIETGRGSLTNLLWDANIDYVRLYNEWWVQYIEFEELYSSGESFDISEFEQRNRHKLYKEYQDIQNSFAFVGSRILAYEKMVEKFTKEGRFSKLKRSLKKERTREPQMLLPTRDYAGFLRRSRRAREP